MARYRVVPSLLVGALLLPALAACTGGGSTTTVDVRVLATTDLHGAVPYDIAEFVAQEREADPGVTLVDAGDFFDGDESGAMEEFFLARWADEDAGVRTSRPVPIVGQMRDAGYDAVVLGNHEFVSNDLVSLDDMVGQFEEAGVPLLSANTYRADGSSFVRPYVVKEVETPQGVVRLGVLGLTITEVGEGDDSGDGAQASGELADQPGYDGELAMRDLVEEARTWVGVMQAQERTDVIVAVVHSGEEPKNPKHPGNRIKELARTVEGIDAIVAGHTHALFEQHEYDNPQGREVVVTQPGSHGEAVSELTFELEWAEDAWRVTAVEADLTTFDDPSVENDEAILETLFSLTGDEGELRLDDALPFEWDVAYGFTPGATKEDVYAAVGYRWMDIAESRDAALELVFLRDGRVTGYVRLPRDLVPLDLVLDPADAVGSTVEIRPGGNDAFAVERVEGEDPGDSLVRLVQE